MSNIYEVFCQVILIVLSCTAIANVVSANKTTLAYRYYGAYSFVCFVITGWIAFAIYCINK